MKYLQNAVFFKMKIPGADPVGVRSAPPLQFVSKLHFMEHFGQILIYFGFLIYLKHSHTLILFSPVLLLRLPQIQSILPIMNGSKMAGWVANSIDPNQTPRSAASDLALYCLLRHFSFLILRITSKPLRNPGSVPECFGHMEVSRAAPPGPRLDEMDC